MAEFEEVQAAYDEGQITEDQYNSFLNGDELELDGDTADDEAAKAADADAESGDSPASIATDETDTGAVKAEDSQNTEDDEQGKEPVVLTADGKHTIPYSEHKELRDSVKELKEQNQQLNDMLQENKTFMDELKAAQKTDAAEGNTEATDELFADLEEDYPDVAKTIKDMRSELSELKAKDEEKVKADEAATEAEKRQAEFDGKVSELAPNYEQVKATDEFWTWFEKQPSYVQVAARSGDPQAVADIIKSYESQQPAADSDTSEKDKKKDDPEATAKKVADALDKAGKNKKGVQSLSDIPGGSHPAHDAEEAFNALPEDQQLEKLQGMTPEQINQWLAKAV